MDRLTEAERDEVLSCEPPPDTVIDGQVLRYVEASGIETELAATEFLEPATFGTPEAIFHGHPDVWWLREPSHGKTIYVGDLKSRATRYGVDSLQLHGYGLVLAALNGADYYRGGELDLSRGTWTWGELVDVGAELMGGERLTVLYQAATHLEGPYELGDHCEGCFQRDRCPAYMLPPEALEGSAVRVLNELEGLSTAKALEAYAIVARAKKSLEWAESQLKSWADMHGGLPGPDGKVWKSIMCKGRETVSLKVLRERLGEEAEQFVSRGGNYPRFQWVNR